MKTLLKIVGGLAIVVVVFVLALPTILHSLGLHPTYEDSKSNDQSFENQGKNMLVFVW